MKEIRVIYCIGLSYICGGLIYNKYRILYYDNHKLLKLLISKCISDEDNIKMECGKCLSNILLSNNKQIIDLLCSKNVINALKYVMKTSSIKLPLIRCIESFDIILSKSIFPQNAGNCDYIYLVEKVGLVEVFDILQAGVDDNDKVFTYSFELVQKYYNNDDNNNNGLLYNNTIKSLICYVPPIDYKYFKSNISIKNNLIFNVNLIKNYLFKYKNILFPINKINAIIITSILQTITKEILNHSIINITNKSQLLTILSLRSVIHNNIPSYKCILNKLDYKLTQLQAENVYKFLINKCNDNHSFINKEIFNDILNQLNIDYKYNNILFNLINRCINDSNDQINMEQFIYFTTKKYIDFDNKKYTIDECNKIRNIFIYKIKQYHDNYVETDKDIANKLQCIKCNINNHIRNKYSKIKHRNVINHEKYPKQTIEKQQQNDKNNICNKLTEIALFLKIFSHFNYEEILTNLYIINRLFHSVSIPLLDILYVNRIYTIDYGYFNSSIYTLKQTIMSNNYGLRKDYIIVLNAILLDILHVIIDKIQLKYIKHNNNVKKFNLIDNDIIHQILTEIFESGQFITNIVLQIDKITNPYANNDDDDNKSSMIDRQQTSNIDLDIIQPIGVVDLN